MSNPQLIEPLADSHGNSHYLKQISSFGERWLRVVVNPNIEPKRMVTVFLIGG
ncbi:MAG: DUF4258 domain-containing protein [Nostocales cyanobacterium W4_Combined_metabat2_030]|nr:DUF4258 domain-containing protein [Nostocales cyanobacterium W4_Combined_metabat2_030]